MIDFIKLKELVNSPAYLDKTSEEVYDLINIVNITRNKSPHKVPIWQIKDLCLREGAWVKMQLFKDNTKLMDLEADPNLAAVYGAVVAALEFIDDTRFENIDLDLVEVQSMIGALQAGGLITASGVQQIYTLGQETVSAAVEAGACGIGEEVCVAYINRARSM